MLQFVNRISVFHTLKSYILYITVVFFRFLVASMQSICLEGLGGESRVDPRLQETTFIQHTFGGRLMSKVLLLISSLENLS